MKFVSNMEEEWFYVIFLFLLRYLPGFHSSKESQHPLGEIYKRKRWIFYLKEISKEGIEKLIEKGFLKNTKNGYVNPKKDYHIGYYKTCGGHRYIEDWYCDKAEQLR